ncbi:MAG: formate dehydrogenase, partial [Gammaproteobacteria bacterium]|nr:formate dehydrogenase [Gammaproteobacteria bacterium]
MLTSTIKVFVPRDTTACSLGSDKVADQLQQHFVTSNVPAEIIRNGSRGLYWLEPLIEIETEAGRFSYGPIKPDEVSEFIAAKCWEINDQYDKYLGLTENIPYLRKQQRITFARVGL